MLSKCGNYVEKKRPVLWRIPQDGIRKAKHIEWPLVMVNDHTAYHWRKPDFHVIAFVFFVTNSKVIVHLIELKFR